MEQIRFLRRVGWTPEEIEHVETARAVVRFQAGERDAFEELYERYFVRVFTYLRVALDDVHEAEDSAQEVFLSVMQALPEYELRGKPFMAWLFRVLRNHVVNVLVRRKRLEVEDPQTISRRQEANGGELDVDLVERLSDQDLMVFVQRMPLLQRQVLMLRFMMDMSVAEVAEVLGRSPESIRQSQLRALSFLRSRVAGLSRRPCSWRERQPSHVLLRHAEVLRMRKFMLR